LHLLVFTAIHAFFSLYIRFRHAYHAVVNQIYSVYHYHHRTPELIQGDVKALRRLPNHLSVILTLEDHGMGGAGLERLVNEAADIAAWCASAGIPELSIYEKTGTWRWTGVVGTTLTLANHILRDSQGIHHRHTKGGVPKARGILWAKLPGFEHEGSPHPYYRDACVAPCGA